MRYVYGLNKAGLEEKGKAMFGTLDRAYEYFIKHVCKNPVFSESRNKVTFKNVENALSENRYVLLADGNCPTSPWVRITRFEVN